MRDGPKIGLALGSGAARGLAHIGVLEVLEEYGIYPSAIAGSSIGAIIGALYAVGIPPKTMASLAKNLDMRTYYDIGVPKLGFLKGDRIEELIKLLTKSKTFDELNIPLKVTAVDLKTNETITLDKGPVYRAVRASLSIPGIFVPVIDGDRVLVDGGLLERVPTGIVRDMEVDMVIGVDVGFRGFHDEPSNILEILLQSFEVMELAITNKSIHDDDIYVYPELGDISPSTFDKAEDCIQKGREATLKVIDNILRRVKNHSVKPQ